MSVLMISPTPTHPPDAGNRARILGLAEEFRRLGADPFFLYHAMEPADLAAMRDYWGGRLRVVPARRTARIPRSLRGLLRPGFRKRPFPEPLDIDAWFAPRLGKAARRLDAAHRFRLVCVEYVFLSRVLEAFGPSVLKVIDTHDVFSERYAMMRTGDMAPEWFYTDRKNEQRGLARADWVIAIHENDAAVFRDMGLARITAIGHFPAVRPGPGSPDRNRILFVGSHNSGNVKAWDYFAGTLLGPILERVPGVKILVAGTICQRIPGHPRAERLGPVEDLGPLYSASALAVNPEVAGTGLKIKTLEPLANGCPVVATPAGIRGIEEAEGRGVSVGRTPGAFADAVAGLMTRPSFREEQSLAALDFAGRYLARNRRSLSDLMDRAGLSGPKGDPP